MVRKAESNTEKKDKTLSKQDESFSNWKYW
jgi:hypothetical protein